MNSKKIYGPLMVFCAAIVLSIGGLFIKLIKWDALSIGSARCILSSLCIFIFAKLSKHQIKFNKTVLIGGLGMCGTLTFCVMANKLTSAANAIILQYTAPIFIILMQWIFFHKKPSKIDIITCFFVLLGITIVFANELSFGSIIGNIVALLSGICYATVYMINTNKDGDALSSVLFGHIMCAIIGLPSLLNENTFDSNTILYVVILGVLQLGLGYILFTIGLNHTAPLTASLVSAIEPILNPVLVAIFLNESLTTTTIIGFVIVLVSILAYTCIQKDK